MKIKKKEEEYYKRKNKKIKFKCRRKNNLSMKLENLKKESKPSQSNRFNT